MYAFDDTSSSSCMRTIATSFARAREARGEGDVRDGDRRDGGGHGGGGGGGRRRVEERLRLFPLDERDVERRRRVGGGGLEDAETLIEGRGGSNCAREEGGSV